MKCRKKKEKAKTHGDSLDVNANGKQKPTKKNSSNKLSSISAPKNKSVRGKKAFKSKALHKLTQDVVSSQSTAKDVTKNKKLKVSDDLSKPYDNPKEGDNEKFSNKFQYEDLMCDSLFTDFCENNNSSLPHKWTRPRGKMSNFPNQTWQPRGWSSGHSAQRFRNPHQDMYRSDYQHQQRPFSSSYKDYNNKSNFNNRHQTYNAFSYKKFNSKQFQNSSLRHYNPNHYKSNFDSSQNQTEGWQSSGSDRTGLNEIGLGITGKNLSTKSVLSGENKKDSDTDQVRKDQLKLSLKAGRIIDNILKGGSGKGLEKSRDTEPKKAGTRAQPLQSSKVCSSVPVGKDYIHKSRCDGNSEKGSVLLERAEKLCKQIREKRELTKKDEIESYKKTKTDNFDSYSHLSESFSSARENEPDWQSSVHPICTSKYRSSTSSLSKGHSDFNLDKTVKTIKSSKDSPRETTSLSSAISIGNIEKCFSKQSSSNSSTSLNIKPNVIQSKQSRRNSLFDKISPRCRSLSESSDRMKKGNKLDKDSISKLVNSPRSRKDRLQVLKFLKVHTKQQQKQRPKLNLTSATKADQGSDGQYLDFEDLPEDIQNQVKELIGDESEQDLNTIINLVDSDSDEQECNVEEDNDDACITDDKNLAACVFGNGKPKQECSRDQPLTLSDLSCMNSEESLSVFNRKNNVETVVVSQAMNNKDTVKNNSTDDQSARIKKSVDEYMSSNYVKSLTASMLCIEPEDDDHFNEDYDIEAENDVVHSTEADTEVSQQLHIPDVPVSQAQPIEIAPDPNYQRPLQSNGISNETSSGNLALCADALTGRNRDESPIISKESDTPQRASAVESLSSGECFVKNGQIWITPILNGERADSCGEQQDLGDLHEQADMCRNWDIQNECSELSINNTSNVFDTRACILANEGSDFGSLKSYDILHSYQNSPSHTCNNENINSQDYVTQIYEISLKENVVREQKSEIDSEIHDLEDLIQKTQQQLTEKQYIRKRLLSEEEKLRNRRMQLLKGAVEKGNSNGCRSTPSVTVNSGSNSLYKTTEFTTNNDYETNSYVHVQSMDTAESHVQPSTKTLILPPDNGEVGSPSVDVMPQVSAPDTTIDTNLNKTKAVADSTCYLDDRFTSPLPVEKNNVNENSENQDLDSDIMSPDSGATVKYMGSFSLPNSDNNLLHKIAENYAELQKKSYVFLEGSTANSDEMDEVVELEADGEEQIDQQEKEKTDLKTRSKVKKKKNNKTRTVNISSESTSSSEVDSASQIYSNSPTRKSRKKLNASPHAKLVKEYLHAESSTDIEINGLEAKSKVKLRRNKKQL